MTEKLLIKCYSELSPLLVISPPVIGDVTNIMKIRFSTSTDSKAIVSLHTLSWRPTYKKALNAEYLQNTVPIEIETVLLQCFSEPVGKIGV